MFISQKLCPSISGHKDINFVDVNKNGDSLIFIDPCLISQNYDEWSQKAKKVIDSFFKEFYRLYGTNAPYSEKWDFFNHSHEINATKTGYGSGNNGKAKTAEGMIDTFSGVTELIHKGVDMSEPQDLTLFVERFGEDCLSDVLTNVLVKLLMDFTVEQCKIWNYPTVAAPKGYYFWSVEDNTWVEYKGQCLMIEEEVILLLPKNFVRHRYGFSVGHYLAAVILEHMQDEESTVDNLGKVHRPTKKALKEKYTEDCSARECITEFTVKRPKYLEDYHHILPLKYHNAQLTDIELDAIIYN